MCASSCVVLFTKPAVPGRVKTRLFPRLSPHQAADLHACLQADVVEALRGGPFDLFIAWALEKGEEVPADGIPGFAQEGDDLGERMFNALSRLAKSHSRLAVVGSDHPGLEASHIVSAFEMLDRGSDVVLGPAADGGYFLLALDRPALNSHLFNVLEWSSARVLEETRSRCRDLRLEVGSLPIGYDVDTPADLELLVARLSQGDVKAKRTAALLRSWDLLQREPGGEL